MRRGHPRGGWRGDNPRHFRPRHMGTPGFRPPRPFQPSIIEAPRFPMQNQPRFPFRETPPDHYIDRNQYPHLNRHLEHRNQDKPPVHTYSRNHDRPGSEDPFSIDHHNRFHVSNMGDVDERHYAPMMRPKPFEEQQPHWDRGHRPRPFVQHDGHENPVNKLPVQDIAYSGHRPPASDHYEARPSGIENSNTFSRSVDDTVDIIRRKLQNRSEPQGQVMPSHDNATNIREPIDSYQQRNTHQELTPRKKPLRPKQNMKSNCDQIKNKIVHQLFKMDKDRIHKLMDNPNSSTKFEYAINSLITESQNSFHRHLRETAEKSLCGTRNDIMPYNDENDTIYEDTFMKQMQCILDPQDTILLEDIKPIVMAELNKVLQLNEFTQMQTVSAEEMDLHPNDRHDEYDHYSEYSGDPQNEPQYYEAHSSYTEANQYEGTYRRSEQRPPETSIKTEFGRERDKTFTSPSSLYERRASRKSCDYSSARIASSERRRASVNVEKAFEQTSPNTDAPMPYFDANAEHISDDDDPFEELDKQYHVAVDHNFIAADDMVPETTHALKSPLQLETTDSRQRTPRRNSHKSDRRKCTVKDEIRHPSPNLPLEELEVKRNDILSALDRHVKNELLSADSMIERSDAISEEKNIAPRKEKLLNNLSIKKEKPEEKEPEEITDKNDSSNMSSEKSSINSNSRKRSTDQRPSHRKEKRKKTESTSSDTNTAKSTEKHDSNGKSVLNPKGQGAAEKESKKSDGSTSNYTEKYVKRKESPQKIYKPKKPDDKASKEKCIIISPNHSITKENNSITKEDIIITKENNSITKGTYTSTDQGTSKGDSKIKLKPIDMFTELPKKASVHVHQAHRNTATPVKTPTDEKKMPMITIKPLLKTISKQITRKHVGTQIIRKMCSKIIQTASTKPVAKSVQTDPVSFQRSKNKSTDAFERMKEIDMEIQALVQEKFKLYNSLETNEATGSMQALGMTVLKVDERNAQNADSIIEEFTNIPEDELAAIALESVGDDEADFEPKMIKKTSHQKAKPKARNRSQSPRQLQGSKRTKTPNISLLEQIITDDRPLEEIISLDDLETSPAKPQKKKNRRLPPKTTKPKKAPLNRRVITPTNQHISRRGTPLSQPEYDVKPCFVVLKRINSTSVKREEKPVMEIIDDSTPEPARVVKPSASPDLFEQPAENDFHFQVDMLDVSEDIVIGSEVKIDGKESESVSVQVTEEIVLDNSQSNEDVGTEAVEPQSSGCKMYDFSADEDLKHDAVGVTGNGDAVLAIEFVEQNFLAACLDGNVYHFGADGQLITTLRGSNLAVTCLTIVREKYGTTVYTGSLDSRIRYYDLEDGLEKGPECNVLSPIQTMDRAWDTVFVGTRTGFVLQFECKNNMLIPVSTIKFSDQSILALRAIKEGPRKVLLVAARSENVTIKDAQTGLLLRTLVGPKMTVYTLLYEDGKVYCGTSSNQVQVFDYASGSHIGEHDGGKGAVCLRAAGSLLFAGCYDGCVYVFRSGERQPFAQLRGPGVMLLSLAVVGSKVIVGYKDRSLYIWKMPDNILNEMVL